MRRAYGNYMRRAGCILSLCGMGCTAQDKLLFPTSIPKIPKEQGFLIYLKCLEELDDDAIDIAKRAQGMGQPFEGAFSLPNVLGNKK